MFEARDGSRALITAFALALSLSFSAVAEAKPKTEAKDAEASRIEQKALRSYVAGDLTSAVRLLEQALHTCETGCTATTKSHLHISLGTVRGVGEGDYAAAKKEFRLALAIDPDARLRTVSTPELTAAFEEARTAPTAKPLTPPTPPTPSEKPQEKPATVVGDLFNQDDKPPPPPTKPVAPVPPRDPSLEPRMNWLSARAMFDFAYLSDANICSPGAPSTYYCTDSTGERYTGRPQPNDLISRGFGFSTARLVLGYERLLFAGFTAGAFVGFGLGFAPSTPGRSGAFPLHVEARGTYAFGDAPYRDYVPGGDRIHPFTFVTLGASDFDTHVIIRVNEIPCGSKVAPACKRDLNAYRLVGGVFASLGGGVRVKVEGRHALRAAMRATILLSDASFLFSPELAYEYGF